MSALLAQAENYRRNSAFPRIHAWWVLLAVYTVTAVVSFTAPEGANVAYEILVGVGFLISSVAAFLRFLSTRQGIDALLAATFGLPVIGFVVLITVGSATTADPYSWVDVFFLAAYPLMAMALLRYRMPPKLVGEQFHMWLGATTIGWAVSAYLWLFMVNPIIPDLRHLGAGSIAIASMYAVLDVLLVGVAAAVLVRRSQAKLDLPTSLLTFAFVALAINDLSFLHGAVQGLIQPFYPAMLFATGCILFAGFHPQLEGIETAVLVRQPPRWLNVVPFALAGGLVAFRVFAIATDHPAAKTASAVSAVAVVLVIALQHHRLVLETRRVAEARKDLVNALAHEVRTPLAAIVASFELLENTALLPPEDVDELIQIGKNQSSYLTAIVTDLVDISRGNMSKTKLKEATLPLEDVIADAMRSSGVVDVEVAVPHNLIVTADPRRIAQALGELLENAAAFGSGQILLIATEAAGEVRIEVHDAGEGVDSRYQNVIWDAFERGAHRFNSARQGGGLGLAIVESIAIAHGGTAGYRRSDRLGGSNFWISLPGRGLRQI